MFVPVCSPVGRFEAPAPGIQCGQKINKNWLPTIIMKLKVLGKERNMDVALNQSPQGFGVFSLNLNS